MAFVNPLSHARIQPFWQFLPGTESVFLYPLTDGDTYGTAITILTARQRPISNEDMVALSVIVDGDSCLWTLWDRDEGASPKVGDVIQQQSGVRWKIRRVKHTAIKSFWSCLCQKEVS